MEPRLLYLDSSAVVRLVIEAPESLELEALIATWPYRVSSQLTRIEVTRACRGYSGNAAVLERCRRALESIAQAPLDTTIVTAAAVLEPQTLSTGAAIHLASALALGDQLGAAVIYDDHLAAAFMAAGVQVLQPGRFSGQR